MGLSWLDFKLGFRMLSRYPMLTVVGSLAMAVAIAVGAGTFEVITRVTDPSLPLPGGDRIVGLNYWHRAESGARPASPYDVLNWREGLRTVEDIGAFRLVQRNLSVGEQAGEPVEAAEISAAAFKVAGVSPLLGRVLVDEDESPQSPAVVVLGNRLWKMRFGADPAVLGRVVRLGADASDCGRSHAGRIRVPCPAKPLDAAPRARAAAGTRSGAVLARIRPSGDWHRAPGGSGGVDDIWVPRRGAVPEAVPKTCSRRCCRTPNPSFKSRKTFLSGRAFMRSTPSARCFSWWSAATSRC